MNTFTHTVTETNRRRLERSWKASEQPSLRDRIAHAFSATGQWLLTVLTNSNQPQISHRKTAQGEIWDVYDPLSERHRQFDSENELRVWLESRYH